MTRRDKLIERMLSNPGSIRYVELDALLRHGGFVLFNQRRIHCTIHLPDGRVLTVVRPHGGRKTCHPTDIQRILKGLGHENDA